jgi:hypothetical protein
MFDKESNRSNDWHACEGCNVRRPHEGVALHTCDQLRLEFHETIEAGPSKAHLKTSPGTDYAG